MRRIWTEAAAILLAVMMLGGCATSKDQLLPHGDSTMLDVWQQETGGSGAAAGRRRGNCSMRARACAAR
jgi:conjugative transfer region lipoprotein (TIGR03751 family)